MLPSHVEPLPIRLKFEPRSAVVEKNGPPPKLLSLSSAARFLAGASVCEFHARQDGTKE